MEQKEKTVLNYFPMCFLLDFLLQEIRGLAAISYRLKKDRCFCQDLLEEVFLISVSVLVVNAFAPFIPGRMVVAGIILNFDFGGFFFSCPKQLGPRQVPTLQKIQ